VSDELDRLWALHGLDEEVHALQLTLARFPGERQALEGRLTEARERLERSRHRVAEVQKQRRDLERDAAALGEEERRFQTQLFSVKKNEEYTALLHEIEAAKQKRSDLETEILLRLEEEEKAHGERPALGRALKQAEEEAAARARAIDAEEMAERARVAALEARREAQLAHLPAPTRSRYERVHASREGRAVVPIAKGACGGCFRAQPPQILQEARRRDRMLSCDGCGRIIVWPPGDS
jgi:hypothetical protein